MYVWHASSDSPSRRIESWKAGCPGGAEKCCAGAGVSALRQATSDGSRKPATPRAWRLHMAQEPQQARRCHTPHTHYNADPASLLHSVLSPSPQPCLEEGAASGGGGAEQQEACGQQQGAGLRHGGRVRRREVSARELKRQKQMMASGIGATLGVADTGAHLPGAATADQSNPPLEHCACWNVHALII